MRRVERKAILDTLDMLKTPKEWREEEGVR